MPDSNSQSSKSEFRLFYTYDPTDPPRYHKRTVDAEYFDWLFAMLKGTGVTFLYRCNLAGRVYYPSRHMAAFDHGCVDRQNQHAQLWHRVADMMDACDPLAEAVKAARRHGVPIWVWWNWNEFQNVRKNWVSLIDPYWYERPRKYWCSRDGSRFYHGVPDYGDIAVRERLLSLLEESLAYGVDGAYLSTRSHSWFPCWQTEGWEESLGPFGFNDSIVEAYAARYGKDIRYEDYDHDAWLRIKGEHFSTLINLSGSMVHRSGLPFVVGISPDRYELMGMGDQWAGKKHLQLYKDWERWVADGSVDGICSEQTCPHNLKLDGATIQPFQDTLPPDTSLYIWLDTAWFENRGGGPFSLLNWNRASVNQLIGQIKDAKQLGAAGAMLHSLYHYTASDSGGNDVGGYGVLPRTEYLDALRGLASWWPSTLGPAT